MTARSCRQAFKTWPLMMVAAWTALGLGDSAFAADPQKQVLVLYSTRRDAQIAVVGDRDLPRILENGLNQSIDYYSEYIDRARFPDPEYRMIFSDFLRNKYRGQRFDVVIAMSDIAAEFIDRTRTQLLRDTPVVYFANGAIPRLANSTGVVSELQLADTVALAVRLHPNLRQVFVVSGAEASDLQYEQQARAQLKSFEPGLKMTYLAGLPTNQLESRLATLPADSIVYFLVVSRDGAGANFHPLDYLDRVANAASVPTYSWVDSAINHGVVGGSLKSQEAQTAAIAALALRVLRGEPADSLPLSSPDFNVRQVDWRQLRRWGISEARVPAGTLVRFREPSAWDRYRGYIVGATVLLLAQAALIGGLLVQASRRRRAELQLRESQNELHKAYARLIDAEETERSRIARDLHDNIGQRMAVLTMELDTLNGSPASVTGPHSRIQGLANQAVELARDIQSISRVLHGSNVDHLGLELASSGFCTDLSHKQKLRIDFGSDSLPDHVPPKLGHCLFRVLQEAVNNAIKHSGASYIRVALRYAHGKIHLEVVDDGTGFDQSEPTSHPGLGLISMRERLDLEGGHLSIESSPTTGTIVRADVPLPDADGPGLNSPSAGRSQVSPSDSRVSSV
jgi:signal transduction histidine kinase